MAISDGYGKTANKGLVFAYDIGDTINSYKGEPTINMSNNPTLGFDLSTWSSTQRWPTGTFGSSDIVEWTDSGAHVVHEGGYDNSQTWFNQTLAVIPGETYTVSVYCLSNSTQAVLDFHDGESWKHHYHSGSGEWERLEYTFNPIYTSIIFRLGIYSSNPITDAYFKNFQLEKKPHSTPFIDGTRSETESLLDLAGNNILDLSNVSFDSSSNMNFSEPGNRILLETPFDGDIQSLSYEIIFKGNKRNDYGYIVHNNVNDRSTGSSFITIGINSYNELYGSLTGLYNSHIFGVEQSSTEFNHLILVWDGSYQILYRNGQVALKTPLSFIRSSSLDSITSLGSNKVEYRSVSGEIPVFRIYNRALTDKEIEQNYNSYKSRFNLE